MQLNGERQAEHKMPRPVVLVNPHLAFGFRDHRNIAAVRAGSGVVRRISSKMARSPIRISVECRTAGAMQNSERWGDTALPVARRCDWQESASPPPRLAPHPDFPIEW